MAEQNISQNINQAVYGLNTDSVPQQVKPGSLTYALNAQVNSFDGQMITYQNEQSNVLCSEFKPGYKVVGFHVVNQKDKIVLFLHNPFTAESEIGLLSGLNQCDYDDPTHLNEVNQSGYVNNGYSGLDANCECTSKENTEILSFYETYKKFHPSAVKTCCNYETVISARCLNFSINTPIHKIIHVVDGEDIVLYWTDNNARRSINLNNLPFKELVNGCDRIKTEEIDCSLLEINSTVTIPCIEPVVVDSGGSLVAGSYQFAARYSDANGSPFTSFFSVTNGVGIFQPVYGLDYNFTTDKSIKIRISNMDTRYNYIDLAVLKTINGIVDVEHIGTYEITSGIFEFTYSGNEKTATNLTIDDIFQKYSYYGKASEINVVGGTLMFANLKGRKRISYQKIANQIKLQWETSQIPYTEAQAYNNGINSALYRGYMRDEVYPFELVFLLSHGQQTDGFHIPGRVAVQNDLTAVSGDDVITSQMDDCLVEPSSQPRWKVYNTATKIGFSPQYIAAEDKSCYKGPYEYGEMAYWESERKYPCDDSVWGELAGTPIRHPKMPDNLITHIHDKNLDPTNKEFDHKIYPLGIRIDLENIRQAIINSDLTEEERKEIVGFKIVRGDRINNKSVIAKGLLYNMGAYIPYEEGGGSAANQQTFYPNYPFNDLGDDPYLTNLTVVGEVGFDIGSLTIFENSVENSQQQLDTIDANMPTITSVRYTEDGTAFSAVVIEIKNSELNSFKNNISNILDTGSDLLAAIGEVENYINIKVQAGESLCQSDVDDLTIDESLVQDYLDAINDLDGSGTLDNFRDIVAYIDANANDLNDHPSGNDIFELKVKLKEIIQLNTYLQSAGDNVQTQYDVYEQELNDPATGLVTVDCTPSVGSSSAFSSSRFTFHSPDTHFYQPLLGSILKLETVEGGTSIGNFVQVQDHAGHKMMSAFSSGIALGAGILVGALFAAEPKMHIYGGFTAIGTIYHPTFPSLGTIAEKALFWNQQFKTLIDTLLPFKNYAYQYNAVGIYNTFNAIPNAGNKQRSLDKAYYLLPGQQSLGDIYPINNWKRESSVFFRTNQEDETFLFPNNPTVRGSLAEDTSRVNYSSDKQIYSDVLSYYASNKRRVPDQYGDIYSYNTVDTGYCGLINLDVPQTGTVNIFGGDVFINRFGLKKKLSYFIDTAVGREDGSDIDYSNLSNVGRVKYWYNTSSAQTPNSGFKGLMKSILNVPQSNFDGNTNKLFYQNGRIYLYSYGIAYFFTESEVNVDFRQAGNPAEKDFYPNVGTGIPNDWLQEKNVPIVNDNYYIYNKSYSKQNKENYFTHLPLGFDADFVEDYSNRVFYSDPGKWNIYKPISFFDFPKSHGKLISMDTIDNQQILVRFENKTYIYNVLDTIQTNSGKYATFGNDDVFSSRPIDFGETDLGYAGSQHKFLLKTEAGHLFIDAKRGSIFLLQGTKLEPISDIGKAKWFDQNLPFVMSKYFDVNTDNHFNGIGITGVWDNKYQRFIITKLDYEPVKDKIADIKYDSYTGSFTYKNQPILLEDDRYFINRSWTMSYSPAIKAWVSYHSYLPNYYIPQNGYFMTGKNNIFQNQSSSIWSHNLVHTSYQTFYGNLEPYTLGYPIVYKAQDEIFQGVKDYTSVLEYYNENDFYEVNDGVYFNKAILSNRQQTSGIRNLVAKPKGNLSNYFDYPKFNTNSIDILYTKSDNFFNYNSIWDVVKNPNNHIPIWVDSKINKSVDKDLNNDKLDYSIRSHQKTRLRAKELEIRHINDKYSRYKFISRFITSTSQISFK